LRSRKGGSVNDTADYLNTAGGVTVDLSTGTATGAAGNDTLSGIENVRGSAFGDTLAGDAGANLFWGGAGNDQLAGGAGLPFGQWARRLSLGWDPSFLLCPHLLFSG